MSVIGFWGYDDTDWDSEYDSTWEDDEDYELLKEFKPKKGNGRRLCNRAARDLQRYRHGYPDTMQNLKFYRNVIPFEPYGVYIENILNYWKDDYSKLEQNHSFIQWLFPLQEPGMNSCATPLTKKEIEEMKKDEVVMKRFLESYKLMLGFYGIELVDSETGELKRAKNWQDRFSNLNANTHNNLRITRILKCLGELGYKHFQGPLVKFFLEETLCNRNLQYVRRSALDYFMFTVKNKSERKKLVLFAWENYQSKDKFKWGPVETLKKLRPPAASPVEYSNNEDIEQENMEAKKNGHRENRGSPMNFRPGENKGNEGPTTDFGLGENKQNKGPSGELGLEIKKTEGPNMESSEWEDKKKEGSLMGPGLGEGQNVGSPVDSESANEEKKRVPLMDFGSRHDKENGGALTENRSEEDNEKKGVSIDNFCHCLNYGQSPTDSRSGGNTEEEELQLESVLGRNKEKKWSFIRSSEEDTENNGLSTDCQQLGGNGGQPTECGLGAKKKHEEQPMQSILGDNKEKERSLIKSGDDQDNGGAQIQCRTGEAEDNGGSLLKIGEDKGDGGQPIECRLGDEKKRERQPIHSVLDEEKNNRWLAKELELEDDKKNRGAPIQMNSEDGTEKGSLPIESGLKHNKDSEGSWTECGLGDNKQNGGSLTEDGSRSDRNNEQSPTDSGGKQENEGPPMESVLESKEKEGSLIRTVSGEDMENGGSLESGSVDVKETEKPLTQK